DRSVGKTYRPIHISTNDESQGAPKRARAVHGEWTAVGPMRRGRENFRSQRGEGVMMKLILLRRWTVRALGLLVLVSAMVLGGTARAQNAPSAQLPKMTYTKNTIFHLPVQMEERTRAALREVCLYVKCGTADWVRQETG